MIYILLIVAFSYGDGVSVASSSVEFHSQGACIMAANELLKKSNKIDTAICVPKG